jgi:hypothetical protein
MNGERLDILRSYSEGQITAREAMMKLGRETSLHDVYAMTISAGLPLPLPSSTELARELAACRTLFANAAKRDASPSLTEE